MLRELIHTTGHGKAKGVCTCERLYSAAGSSSPKYSQMLCVSPFRASSCHVVLGPHGCHHRQPLHRFPELFPQSLKACTCLSFDQLYLHLSKSSAYVHGNPMVKELFKYSRMVQHSQTGSYDGGTLIYLLHRLSSCQHDKQDRQAVYAYCCNRP